MSFCPILLLKIPIFSRPCFAQITNVDHGEHQFQKCALISGGQKRYSFRNVSDRDSSQLAEFPFLFSSFVRLNYSPAFFLLLRPEKNIEGTTKVTGMRQTDRQTRAETPDLEIERSFFYCRCCSRHVKKILARPGFFLIAISIFLFFVPLNLITDQVSSQYKLSLCLKLTGTLP